MKSFSTAVVGVSFEGRQAAIRHCLEGQVVRLVHQSDNAFDANAVAVLNRDDVQLGFLPSVLAAKLVAEYGSGVTLAGVIEQVLAHRETWGLRVKVTTEAAPADDDDGTYVQGELGAWALDPV